MNPDMQLILAAMSYFYTYLGCTRIIPDEEDSLIELPRDEIKLAKGVSSLKDQGIDLEKMLQDVEQKYNVIKQFIK